MTAIYQHGIVPEVPVELDKWQQAIGRSIAFTNARGVYAPQAAEHTFALLLGLTGGIHQQNRNLLTDRWDKPPVIEIGESTLGIIGIGGSGLEIAQRAKGFNMKVVAIDPYRTDKPENVDQQLLTDQLPSLMQQSDVVMLACLTPKETHHIVISEMLALMKPTAYLINVTRGKNVDRQA